MQNNQNGIVFDINGICLLSSHVICVSAWLGLLVENTVDIINPGMVI